MTTDLSRPVTVTVMWCDLMKVELDETNLLSDYITSNFAKVRFKL